MLFLKLFRGNAVFFLKGAVKTGIIPETERRVYNGDTFLAKQCLAAERKSFFHDILVDGYAEIFFENMRDMIFAHIEYLSKSFQRQFFINMFFYMSKKPFIKGTFAASALREILFVNDAVHV